MRFASSPIQRLAMSSSSSSTSSFRINARGGRRPWRRGFSDRPPSEYEDCTAPVSGDSHLRNVRDANYALRRGQPGAAPAWAPQQRYPPRYHRPPSHSNGPPPMPPVAPYGYGYPPPSLGHVQRPYAPAPSFSQPRTFRPSPSIPPRHADYYRNWNYSRSQPPSHCEKFVLLSYNILADYLAREHRSQLYSHIPHYILDWEWRKKRLLLEFRLWDPDIMCLQEVDRFHDLEADLASKGYSGIWKMRTGKAVDGCAIFWKSTRFQLQYEEYIEFNKLGLRDNVAQICVLESSIPGDSENNSASLSESSNQSRQASQVVICNIHVLYNPKRGEIKLGQARTLLNRAHAVSMSWNNAPVIVCGDFNCTPKSPLYNFISDRKLDFSELTRDQVSGQYNGPVLYNGSAVLRSKQPPEDVNRFNQVDGHGNPTGTMYMPQSFSSSPFPSKNNTDPSSGIASETADVECGGGQAVEPNSDLCSNQHSNNPGCIVNDGNQDSMRALSSSDQSSTRDQNKLAENDEPVTGAIQSSAEMENKSSLPSLGIILDGDSIVNDGNAKSGTISGDKEEHFQVNSEHVTTNFTAEKDKPSGSSTLVNSDCNLRTLDSLISEAMETVKHDSTSSGYLESKSVGDVSKSVGDACSGNSLSVDEFRDQNPDAVSSSGKMHSVEGSSHMDEGHNPFDKQCTSEETADADFLRELLGTEEECSFTVDDMSSISLSQSRSSSTIHNLEMGPPCMQLETDNSSPFNAQDSLYNPYTLTPMEIEVASGNSDCTSVEHSLKLRSVYTDVEDYAGTKSSTKEPEVTSYHRQFMGTVDYIWSSESLQTVKVLDTIPKHVLQQTPGFPTKKWGSDHVALVCQLAFKQSSSTN